MNEYLTLKELGGYKGYGLLSSKNIEYLVDIGQIEAKSYKKGRFYLKESIEQYIKQVNEGIYKDYYSFKKAILMVTGGETCSRRYYKRFNNLLNQFGITLLENHLTFKPGENWMLKKSEIDSFLEEYTSIQNIYNSSNLNITLEHFVKIIMDNEINIIKFGNHFIWKFVKKSELAKLILFQKTHHVKNVRKELGIPILSFDRVLSEYKIKISKGTKGISVIRDSDYKKLFKLQQIELEKYKAEYLNYSEIKQLFLEYGYKRPRGEVLSKFEKVEVPDLIKVNSYRNITNLYNKKQVMNYLERKAEFKNELEVKTKLKYQVYDDYMELFNELLHLKNVILNKDNETISYWVKYCERVILKTSRENVEGIVVKLCNATLTFLRFLNGKELTDYSIKEINMGIFNSENIPITYKTNIATFIRLYNSNLKKRNLPIIDVKSLNLKRKSIAQLKKDTYTSEQYHTILKHMANFKHHFHRSIEDYKKRGTYSDYADFWLYVLLHLNNAWRAADIRNFKYSNKSFVQELNINNIDDFYTLELTQQEVDKVFYSYVVQEYFHSKNDAETELRISSNLRHSFAYCVIFLEWKNINLKDSQNLIKLQTNNGTVASLLSRKSLFELIYQNFKFGSRKFNRTLLSLVDDLSKDVTGGNNIFVGQLIRGHVNGDTTHQHYIHVSQERIDTVTLSLFDFGTFGYVYKKLISTLYDELEWPNHSKHHLNTFRNTIGEIYEIEQIACQINIISEARKKVEHEIGLLNKEEIKSILNNISLGLNPSKQKNVQCLFKLCVEPRKECDLCPFSIPNMYSYINIVKRFYTTLLNYLDISKDIDVPVGEKKRQYNLLVLDLEIVLEGAATFGEYYLESILNEDFDCVLNKLEEIGEPIFIEGDE